MFTALGAFIYRRRWVTLAVAGGALLLAIASLLAGGKLSAGTVDGLEATRADQLISSVTGHNADTTFVVLFRSAKLAAADSIEFSRAMEAALKPLRTDPRVEFVQSTNDVPAPLAVRRRSSDDHVVYALVSLRGELKEALANYAPVRAALTSDQLEISATGRLPFMQNLNTTLEKDLLRAELISIPLALLVLLLVFRTVVAALLPIGVGALAVVGGVGVLFALSHVTDISQYSINVCSLIGLGVAIDYSLFMVARYREELALGHGYPEALSRAVDHAGKVVLFSALAVGLGLSGLLFFTGTYLMTMGLGGAIVVSLAALFALTFLPALLAVLGPRINALKLPLPKLTTKVGLWHRLAQWVMLRPVQVLVPTLAVLLVLGSPALHLRMGSADVSVLPEEADARRGYTLLERAFPDEGDTEFTVAIEFPTAGLTLERAEAVGVASSRIAALGGVRTVQSLVPEARAAGLVLNQPQESAPQIMAARAAFFKDRVIFLRALTTASAQSDEARAIVRAIRAMPPVADGARFVGSETALDLDTTAKLMQRVPWAVGFIVIATLVVLSLLLGSVLLPLKAVFMNLLSIGGAYGALVFIFQDGHLISAPGRPLEPALPVLLFCVLFGLSMDYEVLILSRMKEAWDRTHDNRLAVGEGLEMTGGLVTSAAAIMVSVFMAFGTAQVVLIQAVGVGMAVAVALDATLVRVLLVPATMRLFGDANWWAPNWAHALRRSLGLERQAQPMQPAQA